MPTNVPGIHHVTAVATDPNQNHEFYTQTLGLRLVKRSVNQDDVSVYHLFYGDRTGSPGTSITFFPYPDATAGQIGTGQVSTTQFTIPERSVEYWTERFDQMGVDFEQPHDRFGDTVVPFTDPDGLQLELVGCEDAPDGDPPDGPVPETHAIRGFFGVTLSLQSVESTSPLLEDMGFDETDRDRFRRRFRSTGDLGAVVDLCEDPQAPRGKPGAGTVHHVAFEVRDDEHPEWRELLSDHGYVRPRVSIESGSGRCTHGPPEVFSSSSPRRNPGTPSTKTSKPSVRDWCCRSG